MTVTFFERFRTALRRYAEGVHRLGDPAPAQALAGLPDELASFYRSWNGGELFVNAYTIVPVEELAREPGLLVFGATAGGDRFALDDAGRVVRVEEESGEPLVEGTTFARWLEGVLAADAVLYDREGEWNDVFDDSGEELRPEAVEKRERRALKVDPDAPAPAWRLARALERSGRADEAARLLERVVATAPAFGWAWFDLGRLRRDSEDLAGAEKAFARAAAAGGDQAGYFAAHAARTAAERGDEAARARHATQALSLAPDLVRAQKQAAAVSLEEERLDEAHEAAAVAAALAPRDLELIDLRKRLRERLL